MKISDSHYKQRVMIQFSVKSVEKPLEIVQNLRPGYFITISRFVNKIGMWWNRVGSYQQSEEVQVVTESSIDRFFQYPRHHSSQIYSCRPDSKILCWRFGAAAITHFPCTGRTYRDRLDLTPRQCANDNVYCTRVLEALLR